MKILIKIYKGKVFLREFGQGHVGSNFTPTETKICLVFSVCVWPGLCVGTERNFDMRTVLSILEPNRFPAQSDEGSAPEKDTMQIQVCLGTTLCSESVRKVCFFLCH